MDKENLLLHNIHIKDNGKIIISMDMVYNIIQMDKVIEDHFSMESKMELVIIYFPINQFIREDY